MEIKLYSTLTNKKETFVPVKEGKVSMYLCGPTVYDHGHLGHGRSAVAFDIIRRTLDYFYGPENVKFVTNYTDVDDKMITRANEEGITVPELAARIIPEYEADYAALGIKKPTIITRATEYIPQMIELVKALIEKGYAYDVDGDVYYEIEKFTDYGKLSNQKREDLQEGARVAVDDKKKHPHDFALWKAAKPGEPSWDSPWGKGRPGWHLECSAMSHANLGQPFDIHGGGMDLTFPHHECEIAQSEAAYDAKFCNYWLHNGFITINKEKMSKSLGNFFTLKDIFKKYKPQAVRYLFLTAHYRSPIEFSDDQLTQAENSLKRIHDFVRNLKNSNGSDSVDPTAFLSEFETAISNDFDTVKAIAALFSFIKEVNKLNVSTETAAEIMKTLEKADTVLGIMPQEQSIDSNVETLIKEREQARADKNWARSDKIRDELLKQGIELEDTSQGTIWKKL
jgi:cysteinyl-tRNA synthetase